MSLQEYFQFPEMRQIKNPVHEYFRLHVGSSRGSETGWIEEGNLQVEAGDDGWVLLGAEHQELARIAVGRSRNRHYYAYAWDGSYIGPILRTTVSALRAGSFVILGTATIAGAALRVTRSLVLGPAAPPVPSRDAPLDDRFVEESVEVGGHTWYFRIWLPPDLDKVRRKNGGSLPAFLMLHGFKECGWDNWWQTNSGLAYHLKQHWKWASWFPGILVLPQLPRQPWDEQWWEHWRAPAMQEMALACLEQATRKYNADRQRLYLLGESLGTEGCWYLAAAKPNMFAAVGGSCGSVEPYDWKNWEWGASPESYGKLADAIGRDTPFWFCHGSEDDFVPIDQSRRFCEALRERRSAQSLLRRSPAGDVVFKEYADMDHHVWDKAYEEDDLIQWLLSHKKP